MRKNIPTLPWRSICLFHYEVCAEEVSFNPIRLSFYFSVICYEKVLQEIDLFRGSTVCSGGLLLATTTTEPGIQHIGVILLLPTTFLLEVVRYEEREIFGSILDTRT